MKQIIREHYMRKDEKPEVVEDWLTFFEGAICKELVLSVRDRPLRMTIEFSRVLFDKDPKDPALEGLMGYRIIGKVYELTWTSQKKN
jgi:hypothetical protein